MSDPIQHFTLDGSSHIVSVRDLERAMTMSWAEGIIHSVASIDALIRQGMTIDEALEELVEVADKLQREQAAATSAKA